MSKTIRAYIDKHPDKFTEWWNEDHNERGLDYWVACKEPYFNPLTECSTIHEDTVKETLEAMRGVVKGKHNGYSWEPLDDSITIRITRGVSTEFPYGRLTNNERAFIKKHEGKTFKAERVGINYFELKNGVKVHVYNTTTM